MIIIDTPFHVSFRSLNDEPLFACVSKCKKAWWMSDLDSDAGQHTCVQCGGEVNPAVKGVHYKVVATSNRNLKLSDFEKHASFSHKEKKETQLWLAPKIKIMHLSHVKKSFEDRALKEWMLK